MKSDNNYLEHILDAIDLIEDFLDDMDLESFKNNKMASAAVVRELEIIGEASNNLSEKFKRENPNMPLRDAIDKAPTADSALAQLNGKATRIIAALDGLGIKKDDIKTEAYALNPQYDYVEGVSRIAGYGASQKLSIKVSDIINNADKVSQVVSTAGSATANEVMGIEFTVSNMNDLKQQAKILAIGDAKNKSEGLARAAGVKLGKVENWYENILQAPDYRVSNAGFGGAEALSAKAAIAVPQVPAGTQEIIVEVGLTYEVK